MNRLFIQVVKKLSRDEKGQGMAEYGLILVLIAAVVVLGLTPLGQTVRDFFNGWIDDFASPGA